LGLLSNVVFDQERMTYVEESSFSFPSFSGCE